MDIEHIESDIPTRLFDRKLLRYMLAYAKRHAWILAAAFVIAVPLAAASNALPLMVRKAVDGYLICPPGLTAAARWNGLVHVAFWYGLLALSAFFLRYAQGYILVRAGQKIVYDLRADIFAKVLRLPASYFDRTRVGRLMTRVSSDVEAIQRLLTDGLVGVATDIFTIIGIMAFMFVVHVKLALMVLLLFPVLLGVLIYFSERIRLAHRQVRLKQSSLNAYLQEMITGMMTIQLFNREQRAQDDFERHNGQLRAAHAKSVLWFSASFPAMEILSAMTLAMVLVAGSWMILSGDPSLQAGGLVALIMYVRDVFRPLDDLSEKSNVLQAAMASGERIFELLEQPEIMLDPVAPKDPKTFRGEIDFDHVWFAYQGENWVLKDVSLKIRPGEKVAIVGATGAGKSSVIGLVSRFYDVQRGSVKVDGVDVRDYTQTGLRRRIGLVLQDPFMFSGTIADNIHLHNPLVTREAVEQAARYVNAHEFIMARPGGYDGVVLERGAGLSTGQKQLLALARALAQNPDILLVLDEATASVDTETEQLIQDALTKLMKDRTSIIIAHRLSTIRHADRILVMRHGEVIEQGTHEQLLDLNGHYKLLYELLSHTR